MMKGKDKFTSAEILELRELIAERQNASRNYQKQLRNRMRKIGFFGRDDWGIIDCTLEDTYSGAYPFTFRQLIRV